MLTGTKLQVPFGDQSDEGGEISHDGAYRKLILIPTGSKKSY